MSPDPDPDPGSITIGICLSVMTVPLSLKADANPIWLYVNWVSLTTDATENDPLKLLSLELTTPKCCPGLSVNADLVVTVTAFPDLDSFLIPTCSAAFPQKLELVKSIQKVLLPINTFGPDPAI